MAPILTRTFSIPGSSHLRGLGLGELEFEGAEEYDRHEPNWDDDDELASDLERPSDGEDMLTQDSEAECAGADVAVMKQGDFTQRQEEEECTEAEEEEEEADDEEEEEDEEDEEAEAYASEDDAARPDSDGEENAEEWGSSYVCDGSECLEAFPDGADSEGSEYTRLKSSFDDVTNVVGHGRILRPRRTKPATSIAAFVLPRPIPSTRASHNESKGKGKVIARASPLHASSSVDSQSRKRQRDDVEGLQDDSLGTSDDEPVETTNETQSSGAPKTKRPRIPDKVFKRLEYVKNGTTKWRCPFPECDWDQGHQRSRVAQHMESAQHVDGDPGRGIPNGAEFLRQIRAGEWKWSKELKAFVKNV
ncbi:hypothetical protein L226DRAFT_531197 [Lentinus tigrinus ALCF2SS1-7]|uniref:Uncharacterized protein n=1 Tax=Lentinus tigrinus ALCF2SS1-6 TaxID=1328759 RepID=A0A5C2SQ25_9APHY|nr:hypothetical protein L227DRAFT_560055 [Lentinus tigrinus ALCF2SS1-6]RPD79392.1 hypothetical protein L226DRAFT_531197 [Lentinus tigrinus ALCF2SS1-7]